MSVIPYRSTRKRSTNPKKVKLYSALISIAKDPKLSYEEIAKKLTAQGFKTEKGKDCDKNLVHNAISAIRRMEKEGTLNKFLGGK